MDDLIRLFVITALLWALVHYRWLRWGWGRSRVRIELSIGWMYVSFGWFWIALVVPVIFRWMTRDMPPARRRSPRRRS